MIELYTWSTPNGRKVSIMLEAVRLPYRVHPIDISSGDQFDEAFLEISPNNRIPAIRDPEGPDGSPIELFESGAILIYLADKTGLFLPQEPCARYRVLQWLMWQMGNFGPFLGQAHHFNRFATERVPYAIERYRKEANRLWGCSTNS
ncbi:glutathione S-transferase N-terminal domain-containing protein [Marinobacterium aestuariivivens]|uniref:Glutathione S-transferase N-terminal domain-containing protein n=1 Tax=Marinobacterium aestuariivivens TaxID=1698799 RepID=A0ABW1ZTR2_9GAMM